MLLLVGLGNPGARYAGNRHNVGFMAVDRIHDRYRFAPWRLRGNAETADATVGDDKVQLLKPQTYMNESGQAVGEAMRFYKLTPADVVVIYDELDLPPGKFRMKAGGGHGGHNGIKSIDAHCGKDYRRLRIGIGHPGSKERVNAHVLGDFAKADAQWLDPLLEAIGENSPMLAAGENSNFLNKLTLAVGNGSKDKKEPKKPSAKGKSHIHAARSNAPGKAPQSGPMADMLKRLFGKKDT